VPNVPKSFSAYPVSVVLDGNGSGVVSFQATGQNLIITNIFASVSTRTAQATAKIYKGNVGPQWQLGVTNSGSTGGSAVGTIALLDGETIYVAWTGGDIGATATATFTGQVAPFNVASGMITQFAFTDPIAAGDGTLIYSDLKSAGYTPGVSGWRISRDGSYELGSGGTIRGDLSVIGADGSEVSILTGGDARVEFEPPTDAAYTRQSSGYIRADINKFGAFEGFTNMSIVVPDGTFSGHNITPASISMKSTRSDSVAHLPFGPAVRPEIVLSGDTWVKDSAVYVDKDIKALGGYSVPIVETGTELVSFALATSFTLTVNYANPFPTGVIPIAMANIASAAGATSFWMVRTDSYTETGFRLIGLTTDAARAAVAWTNIPVTWVATATA
jgi:hypothetical protein